MSDKRSEPRGHLSCKTATQTQTQTHTHIEIVPRKTQNNSHRIEAECFCVLHCCLIPWTPSLCGLVGCRLVPSPNCKCLGLGQAKKDEVPPLFNSCPLPLSRFLQGFLWGFRGFLPSQAFQRHCDIDTSETLLALHDKPSRAQRFQVIMKCAGCVFSVPP